ncbi:N-methyl-L-tryptophan oxidase [Kurthia sibirica]|uniref:N-methyl-L-tryptophan oxidase n=1 Tax=Kurthia sibirica TaxID=202750 RepID=A0A2U3AK91_9BACL|nr:N-methyl-L-tryptophan oxidase [Kurthia sibirica]PWI24947.1 N-methyl-L-tryptophan oxidase [Kurthia sibirica]GEK33142.1 N-methyltryptophan oxidase [Kurthia sibirica]
MHFDTIIIGGGSMGMSAGYFSAKNGKQTLIIDRYEPPHHYGSHHGNTRIIRYAYGEGLDYVPLALRAKELWQEAEMLTQRRLISAVGVLNIGCQDDIFMKNIIQSAKDFNLPLVVMTKEEIEKKWPTIHLQQQQIGCYEPSAGYLHVEDCIAAYKDLAQLEGAYFSFNNTVLKIEQQPQHIVVHTTKGHFTADHIIVTVGAWAHHFLQEATIQLPLTPLRKTFAWFEASEHFSEEKFPCFSFIEQNATYYGFPNIDGTGLKIGRHDGGQPMDPRGKRHDFGSYIEDEGDLVHFLKRYMPSVSKLIDGQACMYSMTPDEDFIIDYAPTSKRIIIAAGFSGHGFKFASAIGELLSQLANDEKSPFLSPRFAINRFIT